MKMQYINEVTASDTKPVFAERYNYPLGIRQPEKMHKGGKHYPGGPDGVKTSFFAYLFTLKCCRRREAHCTSLRRDGHLSSGVKPSSSSARASWSGHDVGFAPQRIPRRRVDDLVGFHSSAERGNTLRVSGAAPDEFHRFYGVSVKLDLDFAGAGPVRGVSYLVHVFSPSSAKASFLFVFVICFITA